MEYTAYLKQLFENEKNEEQAYAMARYMKDQFPFYGIKTPERRKCMSVFFRETGILKLPLSQEFCLQLWAMPEREYQNAALDYLAHYATKLEREDLSLLKTLITTKSWWDTVDMIATKLVGNLVLKNPDLIDKTMNDWVIDENIWLRRTAILFQLSYKDQTNEEILYEYIVKNANRKEFFIQKAIGWALREYSKTNPESVLRFINETELAPLSKREGSKYLKRGN